MHPSLRGPLLWASVFTASLTAGRLAGELLDGPAWLFGRAAGGGGGVLGISWLMPVVGVWFGWALGRAGAAPSQRGRRLGRVALALGGVAIVFALAVKVLGVNFGTFAFVATALPLLAAWGTAGLGDLRQALWLYALAARMPICAITVAAVAGSWGTHYELLAPGSPPLGDVARTSVLIAAQLCLQVPLTLLVGAFAALLAARDPAAVAGHLPAG